MSKSWYLLCYRYGHSERAIRNLSRLGVKCFSPSKKISTSASKVNCIDITEEEHLFPPYLFIEFDPEEILISSIKYTPGVNHFVSFGQCIKPVHKDVMSALLRNECARSDVSELVFSIMASKSKKQRVNMFLSMMELITRGDNITLHTIGNNGKA